MTIEEFAKNYLKLENVTDFSGFSNEENSKIADVLQYFRKTGQSRLAETLYKDISSRSNQGKRVEALAYCWLYEHRVQFIPQCFIKKEKCYKKDDYYADGLIKRGEKNIAVFDVKNFGMGEVLYRQLEEKLTKCFNDTRSKYSTVKGKYYITVGGSLNGDRHAFTKQFFGKLSIILDELFSKPCGEDYFCIYEGLEIRAHNLKTTTMVKNSNWDAYLWAENNYYYFMQHASQFCKHLPYIIICPFDKSTDIPSRYKEKCIRQWITQQRLRPLCRRIFIDLPHKTMERLSTKDGKAIEDVTIAEASMSLSAILFLDISCQSDTFGESWAFINPNAHNPLTTHDINMLFKFNNSIIDDFQHDNY